jgi:hypothetical protein
MKSKLIFFLAIFITSHLSGQVNQYSLQTETLRWSVEKANQWYESQPLPCGFNYVPANAISYTEMWMPYCFDTAFIARELLLAQDIGFNCLRVVLPFVVWEYDQAAFKNRLHEFLEICKSNNLKVMLTLFDDCAFGADSNTVNPVYGKQPEVLEGWYANGWTASPGHSMVRNSESWPRLEKYVKDIITTFKNDSRVWVWDLYNEPTNGGLGDTSLNLVVKVFEWAREVNPSQPLTIAQWNNNHLLNSLILNKSDIITFHCYSNPEVLKKIINTLKIHQRPIINTEWLCRHLGSEIETCLPVFVEENAGSMLWGLVNGKTQTHLHWGWKPGKGEPDVWQHDLFHNDHRPYDPNEILLLKETLKK